MRDYLAHVVARDAWLPWILASGIVVGGTLALAAAKRIAYAKLSRLADQTETRVDDFFVGLLGRTSSLFLAALMVFVALAVAELPGPVRRIGHGAAMVLCLVQAGVWLSWTLREIVERRFHSSVENGDPARQTVVRMVTVAARVACWALLILVALSNLGVDITALVAGLGVGGIAVALATQNILGDVFASISILLDKPFVPGDFVVVEDFMGTVEHIGIKTTRVRSLGGEQIVFSNADLLRSRLRNYKRMSERRVVFRLGVVYQTPPEKLKAIPGVLRAIIDAQDGTRFDRAHFASYGDFALMFEIVYYVLSADYNRYMDVQEAINLEIARRFAGAGIEFAYPTQTLLVQRQAAAAPAISADGESRAS